MTPAPKAPETAAHDRVFRSLRQQIMLGDLPPGRVLTLRGIAAEFGVSMTPVREAARRLVAEGALSLSASGRISVPEPTRDRIEELAAIRALLEPEIAARALPRAHPALIERLRNIDATLGQAVVKRDPQGYLRANHEFHRTLYLRAQAPAMLAMVETVWLQLGPTMRRLYDDMTTGRTGGTARPGRHREILAALQRGDETALREAMRRDVTQGLRLLTG